MDMNLSKFWEIVKGRKAWNVTAHDLVTEQQQNVDWLIDWSHYFLNWSVVDL